MEGGEVMPNGKISNGYASDVSCRNGFEQVCNGNGLEQLHRENGSGGAGVSENVNGDITELVLEGLEGMEECWEDVSDRLLISQMVSDSVIKGMVTAVEQDCAERITAKELEVASLKENMAQKEFDVGKSSSLTGVCKKREKMSEELNALRNLAREQFEKVYKEIECATGPNLLKKTRSGSELVGLGGILQEKHSESWVNVNEMLHCLKTTVDSVCEKVDDILLCPDISFCESRQDTELAKAENVATQSICRSPRDDFEKNLLEQNFHLCGIQNMNWLEKFNDIATLGTKLDAIQMSLSMPEAELISHGSHDLDNLHHKAFGNHATPPTSLCGENGTVDVSKSYDIQYVKHMTKEELVAYFNNIIIKIKRDHESDQHLKTDEYFRLKREYLKLKGSFFTHIKDEEFVALRKKFSAVISKLEDFLSENEKFPALSTNLESMENMMHRLENLLSENRCLRDRLIDKENEVKCLKEQVSSSASEILQHSLSEQNLLKLVESLESAMEDSCIQASLNEEIYNSVMMEQIAQTRCSSKPAYPAETASKYGIEDSDFESLIMQGLNALVFMEIIRDARRQLDDLHQKVLTDEEVRAFLERKSLEKENELSLEIEEQKILKQEILELRIAMENEQKLRMDLSDSFSKEREQFELASQELIASKEHASRLQALITESNKDLEFLRSQHLEALKQIDVYEMEINKLNQELGQTEAVLNEANRERSKTSILVQEMNDKLSLSEAREQTIKKEMKLAAGRFSKLFADFEWRVSGAIKISASRLEDTSSHLKDMANVLTRSEQIFKQKLERRNIDLKMAESEVDLLGDEVDALLRLLEKIYIALDHYSPVLKHYPGIIEILELVRRELTGESTIRS